MKRILDLARKLAWAAGGAGAARIILSTSVPLPDGAVLTQYIEKGGVPLLALYNALGGGALARGSAFALGIMPYLSARTFVALARAASPRAQALGHGQAKWWTRGLTVGFALVQSIGYARFTENLPGAVSAPGPVYSAQMVLMLTSVSTLLMLFAEQATSAGEETETPLLPRQKAEFVRTQGRNAERDPLYISHPTPAP